MFARVFEILQHAISRRTYRNKYPQAAAQRCSWEKGF